MPINGHHGLCRCYYQPDELDIKTLEYASIIAQQTKESLHALDLGCSPYAPQSLRLAKLGFHVEAFDLEKPMENFDHTNQQYYERVSYQVENIADIKASDLRDDYQIIYSNRCLSFLPYQEASALIRLLITRVINKTRFFLGFFAESADYAKGYPIHLPLGNRYVPLDNAVAKQNEMLASVCVYRRDEIYENLLGNLAITIIEELKAKSGSLKIIFETLGK